MGGKAWRPTPFERSSSPAPCHSSCKLPCNTLFLEVRENQAMNPACGKCPRRVNRADESPCAGCRLRRAWSSTLTQLRGSFVMGISVKVPEAPQQGYSDLLKGRVWQTLQELFPSLVMKGKRPSYLCPLEKTGAKPEHTREKKSVLQTNRFHGTSPLSWWQSLIDPLPSQDHI